MTKVVKDLRVGDKLLPQTNNYHYPGGLVIQHADSASIVTGITQSLDASGNCCQFNISVNGTMLYIPPDKCVEVK